MPAASHITRWKVTNVWIIEISANEFMPSVQFQSYGFHIKEDHMSNHSMRQYCISHKTIAGSSAFVISMNATASLQKIPWQHSDDSRRNKRQL